MTDLPGRADDPVAARPSVAERAARRDEVESAPGDRYRSLVHALRASGEDVPRERDTYAKLGWHPVLWRLLSIVIAGVALYAAVRLGGDWLRQQRVDTWTGPAGLVQSGQVLASCPVVADAHDDTFPNWVRAAGRVYSVTDGIRPVPRPGVGETGYIESGYSLGSARLLYDDATPQGSAREYVLVYVPPALAARVYQVLPGCQ